MVQSLKEKTTNHKLWPIIVITFGCFLSAFGYTVFITPMKFYEGGVIGIAFLIHYIFPFLSIGIVNLTLTLIIFTAGIKLLGKSFGGKSVYAVFLFSAMLHFFEVIKHNYFPGIISAEPLLNAFYGGILVGGGMGLVFYHGACTGGSDAFAQIMRWIKRIPIGKTLITVDIIVLLCATLYAYNDAKVEGLEKIMYSFIFIFIQIKVVDAVLNGFNASQRIMITTDKPEEIKDAIFKKLQRGITVFKGTGGYTNIERVTLSTVLPKKNVPEVRRIVSEVDLKAFVVIQDVHQVYGQGFEVLPEEGNTPEMKSH